MPVAAPPVAGLAAGHRDAEVAEAGAAVRVEPDVVRLDVAVDDAVRVGVGERVGERAAGAQHLGDGASRPPGAAASRSASEPPAM